MRFSLGCRFNCSRQFLEGDGNMSSFKFREAQGKLLYSIRLKAVQGERWIVKLDKLKRAMGIKTKWDRRVEYCARLIGYNKIEWEGKVWGQQEIKRMIRDKQIEMWRENMEGKTSLQVYRVSKATWGEVEGLYDNSRGSGLLADARAGMLDTNVHRRHFEEVSGICAFCNGGDETVEHVVVACPFFGVRQLELSVALGLGDDINWQEVNETKRRLSWWKRRKETVI